MVNGLNHTDIFRETQLAFEFVKSKYGHEGYVKFLGKFEEKFTREKLVEVLTSYTEKTAVRKLFKIARSSIRNPESC